MKHRIEPKGESESGWSQLALILEVDQFSLQTINEVLEYLIRNVDELFQKVGDQEDEQEYEMFPIELVINESFRLSEKMIWALAVELLPNAGDLVIKYVSKVCDFAESKNNTIFMNDEVHFAGSHALRQYLDVFLDCDDSITEKASKIYNTFYRHLRNCDLEYEYYQDKYIEKILSKWDFDKKSLIDLFCFRLFHGQDTDKDFRYLNKIIEPYNTSYRLKEIIDFIINNEKDSYVYKQCRYREDHYLKLCASVYGSNEIQTREVIAYVERCLNSTLKPMPKNIFPYIQRIRDECDAFRKFQKADERKLDTGFHIYDYQSKKWENK